jgi:threonine/homoserine/homoserine lactone efflux protein
MTINTLVLADVISFWLMFYITPGPVWGAVMSDAKDKNIKQILSLLLIFSTVNISVQFTQAVLSVVFMDTVIKIFASIDIWLYFFGASYILYLALKVFYSTTQKVSFTLQVRDLAVIMLLSPKIWTLFPVGATLAYRLSETMWVNAIIFAILMIIISSFFFFVYVGIAKSFYYILKDKFNYITTILLLLFALFLLVQGVKLL